MSFPHIKFGRCEVCGGQGADYASPGNASPAARDTTGNGLVLEYHDGKLVCEICKKRLIADEESLIAADRHAEEEEFRGRAGFLKRVPD